MKKPLATDADSQEQSASWLEGWVAERLGPNPQPVTEVTGMDLLVVFLVTAMCLVILYELMVPVRVACRGVRSIGAVRSIDWVQCALRTTWITGLICIPVAVLPRLYHFGWKDTPVLVGSFLFLAMAGITVGCLFSGLAGV